MHCKNNVILDYHGVWRTNVVNFFPWASDRVDDNFYNYGHVMLMVGEMHPANVPLATPLAV